MDVVGFLKFYFYWIFKGIVNELLLWYVNWLKLERVIYLFIYWIDMMIIDIVYYFGFIDLVVFFWIFKNYYGVSLF